MKTLYRSLFIITALLPPGISSVAQEITVVAWMREINSREDHDWGSREEYRCAYAINNIYADPCAYAENVESERWQPFRDNGLSVSLPASTTSYALSLNVWEEDGGDGCTRDDGGDHDSFHGLTYFPRLSGLAPIHSTDVEFVVNNSADRTKGYILRYTLVWHSNRLDKPKFVSGPDREVCYDNNLVMYTSTHGMSSTLAPSYRWKVQDMQTGAVSWYTRSTNEFNVRDHLTENPASSRHLQVSVATFVANDQASIDFSPVFDITVNGTPNATLADTYHPLCHDQSGSINIASVTGASELYDFILLRNNVPIDEHLNVPSNTSRSFGGLTSDVYTLKVTDKTGPACFTPFTITINPRPAPLKWEGTTSDFNGFDVSCAGASDGAITLAASGGTPRPEGYTFEYLGTPRTGTITSLPPGTYPITIRDRNQCVLVATETLTAPPSLIPGSAQVSSVSCRNSSTPDGSITINGTGGGVPPYQYQVDGGTWQSTTVFSGLAAKKYQVGIKDRNECTVFIEATVTQPDQVVGVDVISKEDVRCYGNTTGSFTIKGKGGTPFDGGLYKFAFNGGPFGTLKTEETYTDLGADTYDVAIQDRFGCTYTAQVTITQPDALTAIPVITPVSCGVRSDGSVDITLSDGTAPYFYFDEASGEARPIDPATHTLERHDLAAGTYTVRVKDSKGCSGLSGTGWMDVNFTVGTTPALEVYVDPADLVPSTCAGGPDAGVTIRGRSGTPDYWFSANGSDYDQHEEALPEYTFSALTGGATYIFHIRDARDCKDTLKVIMLQPEILDLADEVLICPGQVKEVEVPATGTYQWTSDKGFSSDQKKVQLIEDATYTLHVVTVDNCIIYESFVLRTLETALEADLLMSDEAIEGDTLVGIDLSYPVPQKRFWLFEGQDVDHVTSAPPYEYFRFNTAGLRSVVFVAQVGECLDTLVHHVNVRKAQGEDNSGGKLGYKEPVISEFVAYPNPAREVLSVSIALSKVSDVRLTLMDEHFLVSRMTRTGTGSDHYEVTFDVSALPAGLYFLKIEAAGGENDFLRVLIVP